MNESTPASTELIFNGTGVNYSWHYPKLMSMSFDKFKSYKRLTFISGASTALMVYWAKALRLLTWTREDFLKWNEHSSKVYGTNLVSGAIRFARLSMGSKKPF